MPRSFNLITSLFVIGMVVSISSPVFAEEYYSYKTRDIKTQAISDKVEITVKDEKSGGKKVESVVTGLYYTSEEDYTLDANDATLSFSVSHLKKGTNYTGSRKGNTIILTGEFRDKPLNRKVKIDKYPFHFNPIIGLKDFILSKQNKTIFWTIRPDDLAIYRVVAVKRGIRIKTTRSGDYKAYKVTLAPTGFLGFIFKQTLWFKVSNGVYVYQKLPGGKVCELVEERE